MKKTNIEKVQLLLDLLDPDQELPEPNEQTAEEIRQWIENLKREMNTRQYRYKVYERLRAEQIEAEKKFEQYKVGVEEWIQKQPQ